MKMIMRAAFAAMTMYVVLLMVGIIILLGTLLPVLDAHDIGFFQALTDSSIELRPIVNEVKSILENDMPIFAKKVVIMAFKE